jgi:hypothetical protein
MIKVLKNSFSKTKLSNLFVIGLISLSFVFTSCSSIINGSMSAVSVNSSPTNAIVKVNGMDAGRTPSVIKLKRGDSHIIEVKLDGFQTYKVVTSNSIAGWFWGNLLCGGIVGIIVDLATGNAYDVEPRVVNAQLNKDTGHLNGNIQGDSNLEIKANMYAFGEFETINFVNDNNQVVASVDVKWE